MKTVYVDVVFAVNFCVDYILLYMTSLFLHIKVNTLRFVAASFVGSLFSVMAAVFPMAFFFRVALTVIVAFLMCFAVFGKRKLRSYLKVFVSFFTFSIILGGTLLMFESNIANFSLKPFAVVLLAVIFAFISVIVLKIFTTELTANKVALKIEFKGKISECVALCDSGNLLFDPYNGLPVILLDRSLREELIDLKEESEIHNKIRFIPVVSVNGKGFVEAITPDAVYVCLKKDKKVGAVVGFVSSEMPLPEGCCGIIPSVLVDNF